MPMTAAELQAKLHERAPLLNWEVELMVTGRPTSERARQILEASHRDVGPYTYACSAHVQVGEYRFDYGYALSTYDLTLAHSQDVVLDVLVHTAAQALAEGMIAWRRPFPIMLDPVQRSAHRNWPTSLPWAMVAPHEEYARLNHGGQSLEQLANRGGLPPVEMAAVLEHRVPQSRSEFDATLAMRRIMRALGDYNTAQVTKEKV